MAVLETPEQGLENIPPGGVCVAFTVVGGRARVEWLPAGSPPLNAADPNNKKTARIGVLVGPGDTNMMYCVTEKDGSIKPLPTTLEDGKTTTLTDLAHKHPGTVIVASPNG